MADHRFYNIGTQSWYTHFVSPGARHATRSLSLMRICLHQSCADTRTTARTSGAVYDFCFCGAPLPSMLIVVVSDMSVSEMPLKMCCANTGCSQRCLTGNGIRADNEPMGMPWGPRKPYCELDRIRPMCPTARLADSGFQCCHGTCVIRRERERQ